MKTGLFFLVALLLPSAAMAQTTIKGSVIDERTEEPLQGVRVALRTSENLEPAHTLETQTDARGRYALKNVPPGRWRVRVTFDGLTVRTELTSPATEVGRKTLVFDFAVQTSPARHHQGPGLRVVRGDAAVRGLVEVKGRVVDGVTGKPVEKARLWLLKRQPSNPQQPLYQTLVGTKPNADGLFRFPPVAPDTVLIRISTIGYRSPVVHKLEATTSMTLAIGLEPLDAPSFFPERLSWMPGYVKDRRGNILWDAMGFTHIKYGILTGAVSAGDRPAAGATIELLDDDRWHTRAGPDGRFEISDIVPGNYALRIVYRADSLQTPAMEIRPGVNKIIFTLQQPPRGQE